jgi:TetR/AcrR family transcriptional regulator, regulator of autoinduction and epiphytic fitness
MTTTPATQPTLSAQKHADIIDAAVALFCEEGFGATSMDRIAQRASVSKRTVYNHFPSKEALFQECVSVLVARMDAQAHAGDDPDAPVAERLRAYASRKLRTALDPEALATTRALMAEVIRDPALGRRLSGPLTAGAALRALLREETARGRLAVPDPDLDLACLQLAELLKGPLFWPCVMGFRDPPSEPEIARVVDDAVTMFLARYAARP